ncbi:MAG: NADH-quinone oxidoreductase subunit NuoB [Nannocystaceae bacterium]|nr:NADH-quinone oxidoreductase subunit NuoB [Nannocystaceae bacterium]
MQSDNPGYVPTTLQTAVNWAQKFSLFTYPFATACCAMEFMSIMGSRYDISRFGAEFPRFSPRQADLLLIVGTITERQAPVLRRVYDQMIDPKWVLAFGVCASTGGFYQNYTVTPGADQIVPVDVYVPGCPPRPEQFLDGLMALQRKIQDHRGHAQIELGNTAMISMKDRRRLPIHQDGTSMGLSKEERMPRNGKVR